MGVTIHEKKRKLEPETRKSAEKSHMPERRQTKRREIYTLK